MLRWIIGVLGISIIVFIKYLVDFLLMKYGPAWVNILATVDLCFNTIFLVGVLIWGLIAIIKEKNQKE